MQSQSAIQLILESVSELLTTETNPTYRQLLEDLAGHVRLVADQLAGGGPEHVGDRTQRLETETL